MRKPRNTMPRRTRSELQAAFVFALSPLGGSTVTRLAKALPADTCALPFCEHDNTEDCYCAEDCTCPKHLAVQGDDDDTPRITRVVPADLRNGNPGGRVRPAVRPV